MADHRWRVFYVRAPRKEGHLNDDRRDQTIIVSESEPTMELVAELTEDDVKSLDTIEDLGEVGSE